MLGNWTHGLVSGVSALWEAGVAGKALAVAAGWRVLSFDMPVADPQNLVVNIVTVAVVYVVARRLAKTKITEGTIKDLNDALAAKAARNDELVEELRAETMQKRQLEQAAVHCRTEATKWQAKYEEAKQYTAQPAVEHFEALLAEHSAKVAVRHEKMLEALEQMTVALALIQKGMNGRGSTST